MKINHQLPGTGKASMILTIILIHFLFPSLGLFAGQNYVLKPDKVSVSSFLSQEVAEDGRRVTDGNLNTAWQYSYNGKPEEITFFFREPVYIQLVKIFNGYGKSYPLHNANGRAREIEMQCDNGHHSVFTMETDIYNYTLLPISETGVTTVTLRVQKITPGSTYKDVAISEIQFFGNGTEPQPLPGPGLLPVIMMEHVPRSLKNHGGSILHCMEFDPQIGYAHEDISSWKPLFWFCYYAVSYSHLTLPTKRIV
mgnify:CR=1 FL=1